MPTSPPRRTRFAPSPTGYLHLGNARTALFNRLAAGADGAMLLRIEDTDGARGGDRHADAIVEDLAWLGLEWTGADARRPWRQSMSAARHARALETLLRGDAAYPCFCPPAQLRAEREAQLRDGRPPRYSGRCAALSEEERKRRTNDGESAAIRFRMPRRAIVFDDLVRGECRFDGADIGDFVARRAGGAFSFFFANALDDAQQGITHVLRGEDHLSNTPRQLAVLAALRLPAPRYGHLQLLRGEGGAPLSKRDGALSVRDLRGRGFLPEAINNYLARVGRTTPDDSSATVGGLAAAFSFSAISKSPSEFDPAQLLHWQKRAIRNLAAARHSEWLAAATPELRDAPDFAAFCAAVRDNIAVYEDARRWAHIVFADAGDLILDARAQKAARDAGADFYATAAAAVPPKMEWKAFCETVSRETGRRGGALFLPLRAALTGRADGPAMPPLFKLIGEKRAKERLLNARPH